VSALASGGEVLLTDATRSASGPLEQVEIRERGRHELKNVGEPVAIYAGEIKGADRASTLSIDAVC